MVLNVRLRNVLYRKGNGACTGLCLHLSKAVRVRYPRLRQSPLHLGKALRVRYPRPRQSPPFTPSLDLVACSHFFWRRAWQALQYSCLESPMDRGARWATVHGVAESDTTEHTHTHFFRLLDKISQPARLNSRRFSAHGSWRPGAPGCAGQGWCPRRPDSQAAPSLRLTRSLLCPSLVSLCVPASSSHKDPRQSGPRTR